MKQLNRHDNRHVNRHDESGATLVEFSVTAGLLFFILFIGIELIRLGFTALTIQFLVSDGARFGSVGTHKGAAGNPNTEASRALEIKTYILNSSVKFGIDLTDDEINICKVVVAKTKCNTGELNSAGPREIFQIEILHKFPLIFPGLKFNISTKAVGKNERFRSN